MDIENKGVFFLVRLLLLLSVAAILGVIIYKSNTENSIFNRNILAGSPLRARQPGSLEPLAVIGATASSSNSSGKAYTYLNNGGLSHI